MDDTIAAISTPPGKGGIAIIRLSGPQALEVVDVVVRCRQGKPSEFPTHTIHLGTVLRNGTVLDRVLLMIMRAPRTYTGENTAEINCHGGSVVAQQILKFCLENGARIADPGEFTKRAFLNGKIDLTQAEAVMDLIMAQTDLAQAAASRVLEGRLSTKIREIRDGLLSVLAQIEAYLDFPEENLAAPAQETLERELQQVHDQIQALKTTAGSGKILRHGVSVTIAGRPNVGKSSLLNRLLGRDRAIVSPIPGTTRDTLEESANIRGIPIRLIDTAGLRKSPSTTEAMAVRRTYNALDTSDLVIHMVDSSRPFSTIDGELSLRCASRPYLAVLNKIDLPQRSHPPISFLRHCPVEISAQTGAGFATLIDRMAATIWSDIAIHTDCDVAINERHFTALDMTLLHLTHAIESIQNKNGLEITSHSVRSGLTALAEITGDVPTDKILDRIFSTFCVGK